MTRAQRLQYIGQFLLGVGSGMLAVTVTRSVPDAFVSALLAFAVLLMLAGATLYFAFVVRVLSEHLERLEEFVKDDRVRQTP